MAGSSTSTCPWRPAAEIDAGELFDLLAAQAWRSGDPGLMFIDRVNEANPVPSLGRIEATNPCGEVPLLPHESCNLGSVNLPRFVTDGRLDWERLTASVRLAVRFLDDVIEVNRYPIPELDHAARRTRKVGLGFMGLAELLAALRIPYGSADAVRLAGDIAREITEAARHASAELAAERGADRHDLDHRGDHLGHRADVRHRLRTCGARPAPS
ncbi:hypothetical protein [Actinoallomurus oryzae]|uniref:hypothetical protein n=1 Tax=Actinoallomurus oryzae TaxID=502180 RepID=UPI003CD09B0D